MTNDNDLPYPYPYPPCSYSSEATVFRGFFCFCFSFLSLFFGNRFLFFFINLFILFVYFWLRWVFVAAQELSLVAVSGGYSSLRCVGFSLRWLLLLRSTGSRRAQASVVVARGLQ